MSSLRRAPLAQLDRALDYKFSAQAFDLSGARLRRIYRPGLTRLDPVWPLHATETIGFVGHSGAFVISRLPVQSRPSAPIYCIVIFASFATAAGLFFTCFSLPHSRLVRIRDRSRRVKSRKRRECASASLGLDVKIVSGRDLDRGMPRDPLEGRHRDATLGHRGQGCVPQGMEGDIPELRFLQDRL